MEEDTKSKGWISDGFGNHIKLNAITAITVDYDYQTYKTIVHFGTGSKCVCTDWSDRDKCEKVADNIFKMIQGE